MKSIFKNLIKVFKHSSVFAWARTPLYIIQEYIHRTPDPKYSWSFAPQQAKQVETEVLKLRKNGIIILPSYLGQVDLICLRKEFDRIISKSEVGIHSPDSQTHEEIFPGNPCFLNIALDSYLLEIIGQYFGRRFGLARSAATRLMPTEPIRHRSYSWHHDARGRQLHIMCLLNDLGPDGQRMVYLNGSHNNYYSYYRGVVKTRFDNDMFKKNLLKENITEVIGKAGTVAIFDSNGLHSGTRNYSGHRDSLLFCYVSKKHFKKVVYTRSDLERFSAQKLEVVRFNPNSQVLS